MKTALLSMLCCLTFSSFGQTDIIEMRSRNATIKKYTLSASIDHIASNFGMAPPDQNLRAPVLLELSKAVLDSVNWVSDSVAIMYTSSSCSNPQSLEASVGSIWKPGADTVINHPLFSKNHSLDSVKTVLDNDYMFYLKSDSTKFIGFDNGEVDVEKDDIEPVKQKRDQEKNSFGWELIFMIVTPIAFILGISRLKLIGY